MLIKALNFLQLVTGLDVSGSPLPRSGAQNIRDMISLTPMVKRHMQEKKKQEEKKEIVSQQGWCLLVFTSCLLTTAFFAFRFRSH